MDQEAKVLQEVAQRLSALSEKNKSYLVTIAQHRSELEAWGEHLSNCIGTQSYYGNSMEAGSAVLFAVSQTAAQLPSGYVVQPTTTDLSRSVFVMDDAYCFVCGRVTDHFGEHEALVEAGLAVYRDNGSVVRTDTWDDELARQIQEREYQALIASLQLDDQRA